MSSPCKNTAEQQARNTWRQFGIRDLLLVTTLVAVVVQAGQQHCRQVQDEQATATLLTEAGGRIVFNTDPDWRNPRPDRFPPEPFQELVGRHHFQSIVSADLCGVEMTPARLQLVLRLKRLRSLDLVGRETNDETLEQLAQLESLQELSLTDTRVTSKGIERLKSRMPQLAVSWCTERDCGE